MVGDIKTESMGDMIPESPGDFTGIRNLGTADHPKVHPVVATNQGEAGNKPDN